MPITLLIYRFHWYHWQEPYAVLCRSMKCFFNRHYLVTRGITNLMLHLIIVFLIILLFQFQMTILPPYDTARKKEPSATFNTERESCLKYFEKWSETDQVEFVENLLARMCHYQHGHINCYLKPMLQRDFISLLPSKSQNDTRPVFQLHLILTSVDNRCF